MSHVTPADVSASSQDEEMAPVETPSYHEILASHRSGDGLLDRLARPTDFHDTAGWSVNGDVWSRVLDRDPASRTTRVFHYNAALDESFTETIQDVEDLLDLTKHTYNSTDERARWKDGQHVASIPLNVYWDLKRQGIVDDPKRFAKWMNDPDNRFFRVRPGKV